MGCDDIFKPDGELKLVPFYQTFDKASVAPGRI